MDSALTSAAGMLGGFTNTMTEGKNKTPLAPGAKATTTPLIVEPGQNMMQDGLMIGAVKNTTIRDGHKKYILPIKD